MGRAGRLRRLHRHIHRRTRIKHEHTHTHNARGRHFPPRHHHNPPAPESKPETTAGTIAAWCMDTARPRYHLFITHHLPAYKMNTFYEHAYEPIPPYPDPDYDPAMDEPEPPVTRRKPPFETHRSPYGQIHTLHSETRLYTGYFTVCGELQKYAGIGIKYARHEPTVLCDRRSAAKMLRKLRKGGVC